MTHNPKVVGSNPTPATNEEVQVRGPFRRSGEGLPGTQKRPASNGLSNEWFRSVPRINAAGLMLPGDKFHGQRGAGFVSAASDGSAGDSAAGPSVPRALRELLYRWPGGRARSSIQSASAAEHRGSGL